MALSRGRVRRTGACAQALTPHQQLTRDIYRELIEIRTVHPDGDNTAAARAMAKRLLDAGFDAKDVEVIEPAPRKGNLVARLSRHGRAEAHPAARAHRRGRGEEGGLVRRPRPLQAHRARRLLLRPRHDRRQGDGRDLRREPHPLRSAKAGSRSATSSWRSPPTRRAARTTAWRWLLKNHRDADRRGVRAERRRRRPVRATASPTCTACR